MNKKTKTFLYIVLFAIVIAAAVPLYNNLSGKYKPKSQLPQNSAAGTSPESTSGKETEPKKALDFVVYDINGKEVRLSDFEGTPVVLNFWASWCPPCKGEMPYFNKVSEEYPEDKLKFLMVDMVDGQRETVETGKKYVEDNKFTFTVLYDTKQDAAITYGVRSIPSTLFISKDGFVEAGVEGALDEETLRHGIDMIVPAEK
jgi:thiol-disulfide isomerase/thioredoxin